MRNLGFKALTFWVLVSLTWFGCFPLKSNAAGEAQAIKNEADQIDSSLQNKKTRIKEVQGLINTYSDRIKKQEQEKISLENQVTLLDNRIKEKELRIEEIKMQTEVLTLELQSLDLSISRQEERIASQKDMVADLIRQLRHADDISTLDVFLSRPSLSSYADRLEELKKLEGDLNQTLKRVITEKTTLEGDKSNRETKRTDLLEQKKKLAKEHMQLEMERNSKVSLIAETGNRQEEFSRALEELRQQQESTTDEISSLERELKSKLDAVDEALAKGQTLLLWPVPLRKITTSFHDPTYPFRYMFEHPGLDFRAEVGTPIKSAAGGYIAWNKTGTMYGNYVMVIHPGNYATVYAHLSKFGAKPNTYVERGDIIGYTGGMPGQKGAGLSTGPHLHFEVRQDGIPVDPMGFLPEAIELDD